MASLYTSGVAGRPAVFIDRDGTLTEEVGYVNHPHRLRLLPRSAEAIRRLNECGIAAVVTTNQAGVARGYFSPEVLHAVTAELVAQLGQAGARLDGIYVCTHHPTDGEPPWRLYCQYYDALFVLQLDERAAPLPPCARALVRSHDFALYRLSPSAAPR